jgi:hypothetical protein
VTHSEALDVLTAWIVAPEPSGDPSPEQKAAAEEHVACCPECWTELSDLGTALRIATPETAEQMRILFGCDRVVDHLYKVVDIEAVEMARRFPRVAAHLARCVSCREILSDLEAIPLTEAPQAAVSWRDLVLAGGERVRELVGDLVFRLRQGTLTSCTWPDGLVLVPVGGGGGPMRGSEPEAGNDEPTMPAAAPGHAFRLDLDTIDLGVELLIESHDTHRVHLEVQVLRGERPVSLALRRVEREGQRLVAAQEAAPSKKFVAPNLPPGSYRLLLERG